MEITQRSLQYLRICRLLLHLVEGFVAVSLPVMFNHWKGIGTLSLLIIVP
uniref:Uncharacterized protein n=1 Tax=Rhizophora mucronata TaxID=61149 RepID=A0A2P2QGS2_RHIMU